LLKIRISFEKTCFIAYSFSQHRLIQAIIPGTLFMTIRGIAVIGSATIDKIIHRDLSRLKIGGVTTYAGITYRRHDIKTLVITNVANRDLEIIKRLQEEQIVVCNGQTELTTHFINYINDDKQRQKIPKQAAFISRNQVINNIKDISFVHLGPLHPSDIDIQAIKLMSSLKLFVILDAQGFVRSVKNNIVYPTVSKHLPAAFKISNIVKANQQEYEAIIDFFQTDLSELMNQFKIKEFVVTSGDKGGFVQKLTGAEIRYEASELKSIDDPTGAGDIFLAAYIIGRFIKHQPIPTACKYAAKLAALQIEGNYIKPDDLCLEDREEHRY
jgi:sugar/nucleoside kinase (ribokinase family)